MDVALRDMGLDNSIVSAIHDMIEMMEDTTDQQKKPQHPSAAFLRDTKAMKNTPADVVELPTAYTFAVDMPGLKSDQINVHIEDDTVLVVSGERRRREKEEGVKFLKMERRFGKLMKRFVLPENADKEKVTAAYEDGVLTVVVKKTPPPEPKKPRVIEVRVGGGAQSVGAEGGHQKEAISGGGGGGERKA